jgi:hypothetical protein
MRELAALIVGLALTGSSIACSSATYGLGDDDDGVTPADSLDTGELGDEETEEPGDDSAETIPNDDDDDHGDGDPLPMCVDPPIDIGVGIELHGDGLAADPCGEPKFSARIIDAVGGEFSLTNCNCVNDCDAFELAISLPDPAWLPQLDPGTCYYFHFYAEEIEPGVCRRNRIDIAIDDHDSPWYSTGSASEDLDRNGIKILPIVADACTDACGEWQRRDINFVAQEVQQTLSWGENAWIGSYKVVNWQSYATPSGCGSPGADITSWTAK